MYPLMHIQLTVYACSLYKMYVSHCLLCYLHQDIAGHHLQTGHISSNTAMYSNG